MTALLLAPIVAPIAAALVNLVAGWHRWTAALSVASALTVLACGAALALRVGSGYLALGGLLRADALSATMLIVIGVVATLATWAGVGYIDTELEHGHTDSAGARLYGVLTPAFVSAMALAVCANNIGVIWVAIEATTIVTAFLVGHRRTKTALEATWKYVVICSVGIAVAFLGTVLMYFAARHAGAPDAHALNLDVLTAYAAGLDPAVTRLAGGLLLIGYGAKAGLFPFHTWLADAHSQAPAPVSALMSGVLLAVAFSVLLRIKPIVDAATGPTFLRTGLVVLGLATLLVAALMLTVTGDVKRMLAYSSMENMGLIAIAAAAGTQLAIAALLLHVLAHGVGKTVLFLAGGQLQAAHGSTAIGDISGLVRRSRLIGGAFAVGLIVLLGLPPFALFASELAIARSLADARLAWALAAAMLLGRHRVHRVGAQLGSHAARRRARERTRDRRARPRLGGTAGRCGRLGCARDHRGPADRSVRSRGCSARSTAMNRDYVRHRIPREAVADRAEELLGADFRLALVAAHDDVGALRVVYLFLAGRPDRRVELECVLSTADPAVPSCAYLSFPAGRFEREMADLYGIRAAGHPRPRRLVRHAHWPQDWHPMRQDAGPAPEFEPTGRFPFVTVEGTGVYEIPVGPVHAGLIEPGHFRFSVVGETVLRLKARLWFVHRGLEKLFEGRAADGAVTLAERVSGDTSAGHALAHSLAVEDALGIGLPDEVHRLRALVVELERLYNHAADLGALANDVGFALANAHAQRIRERLLRLNAAVTGHRLLRGAIHPGGVTLRALPETTALREIAADLAEVADLTLRNGVVYDRFAGTSVLSHEDAHALGCLGYAARASGLRTDARIEHPTADLPVTEVGASTGDVLARYTVRRDEFAASVELACALAETHRGPITCRTSLDHRRGTSSGVGIVEGWRGTIVHRVEIDAGGHLTRAKIVDPSWFNWPALPVAMSDTIVPDFPLTNKSFNLSYAGNDL